jgi:hypothetical protein
VALPTVQPNGGDAMKGVLDRIEAIEKRLNMS